MATTRFIPMHINKGRSLRQSLSDRMEYCINGAKTNNGEFVSTYECDPKSAVEEFLLSKREYQQLTGRSQEHEVIAYQIRQSFKPGEVTPEEANRVGYETALSFTKGKFAFVVATHTDRPHIHNYIMINSTSLDGRRKLRNFFLSSLAIARISDRICLEHGLSIVVPKPYKERTKRTTHPERESFRAVLCTSIDEAMEKKPKDFAALITLLAEAGYEYKSGKHPALRGKGQKCFIRFRSLGVGYSVEELQADLSGNTDYKNKSNRRNRPEKKIDMLIDIQEKLQSGKGAGYERWAKVFNLKQMAKAFCFLQEHDIHDYSELVEQTERAVENYKELSTSIKTADNRLAEISALKKHIINYSKTRDTYVQYRKAGYSKKFLKHIEKKFLCIKQQRTVLIS